MKKQTNAKPGASRQNQKGKSPNSNFSTLPIIIFVVGAGVLVWLILGTVSPTGPGTSSVTASPTPTGTPATNAAAASGSAPDALAPTDEPAPAAPLTDADRQKLLGTWKRTDADQYAIEIRLINPDGTVDARYLNPGPIHVESAKALQADGKPVFFMKLQDKGYPGSTYTLVYDEATDSFSGEYFQAAMGETYAIAFQRER